MFGIESTSGMVQSTILVGIVLVQAIVLYVGYGGLQKLVGPHIAEAVVRD